MSSQQGFDNSVAKGFPASILFDNPLDSLMPRDTDDLEKLARKYTEAYVRVNFMGEGQSSTGSSGSSPVSASATPYQVVERFKILRSETGTRVVENIQTLADTLAGTPVQVVGYQIQLYQCNDETAEVTVQLPSSDAKMLTKERRTTSQRSSSKLQLIETDLDISLAPTAVAEANEIHINLEWTAL